MVWIFLIQVLLSGGPGSMVVMEVGPFASQARALYDPKGDATLEALIQAVIAGRAMAEPSRNLAELMSRA